MEPTLALHLPTFSSRPTPRTSCFPLELTFTNRSCSALKWLVLEDRSSSSRKKVELLIPRSEQNALTRRCTLGPDRKVHSRALASDKLRQTSNSARPGTARVGIVGARTESHNTKQKDCCHSLSWLQLLFFGTSAKPRPLDCADIFSRSDVYGWVWEPVFQREHSKKSLAHTCTFLLIFAKQSRSMTAKIVSILHLNYTTHFE